MQQFNVNPAVPRDSDNPHLYVGPGPAPRLGAPPHLKPPSFYSNLKEFLTERSIKFPKNSKGQAFHTEGLDSSFAESFKAFFHSPRIKGGVRSGMEVDWQ